MATDDLILATFLRGAITEELRGGIFEHGRGGMNYQSPVRNAVRDAIANLHTMIGSRLSPAAAADAFLVRFDELNIRGGDRTKIKQMVSYEKSRSPTPTNAGARRPSAATFAGALGDVGDGRSFSLDDSVDLARFLDLDGSNNA